MDQPLSGLRVLDAGDFLAAPFCAMLLGDFGADVIKVEGLRGDAIRTLGDMVAEPDVSAMFVSGNRGKRSVALDLGSAEGLRLLAQLALASDVVVHNRATARAERLGLDHASLSEQAPGIIVASVTGFGERGPYADRPGFDLVAQAMSGMTSVTGAIDGPPMRSGTTVVDFGAGVMLAYGVMAALWARERSGQGRAISTSLLEVALAYSSSLYAMASARGEPPPRVENRSHAMVADQFATSDGFVVLAVADQRRWRGLCELLGLEELGDDPRLTTNAARMEAYDEIRDQLQTAIGSWLAQELVAALVELRIPCTQTYDVSQLLADPHAQAVGAIYEESRLGPPFHMIAGPLHSGGERLMHDAPPPHLGEHTDEILASVLGLSPAELDVLAEAETIRRG